jgi:hypothetical protein
MELLERTLAFEFKGETIMAYNGPGAALHNQASPEQAHIP